MKQLAAMINEARTAKQQLLQQKASQPVREPLPPLECERAAQALQRAKQLQLREKLELTPGVRNKSNLFARPHPLSALKPGTRRKVPVLVNANGIPFLRLKKPQPLGLSYVIRRKIEIRQKRFDRMYALEEAIALAQAEEMWDEFLKMNLDGESAETKQRVYDSMGEDDPGWTEELQAQLEEVREHLNKAARARIQLAARMQGVVDRERELAKKEKLERRLAWYESQKAKVVGEDVGIKEAVEASKASEPVIWSPGI